MKIDGGPKKFGIAAGRMSVADIDNLAVIFQSEAYGLTVSPQISV